MSIAIICSGVATLSSGTVTVSTSDVQVGDNIMVSFKHPSQTGTGHPSLFQVNDSDIVANTSFIINAVIAPGTILNSQDNSDINWVILRNV